MISQKQLAVLMILSASTAIYSRSANEVIAEQKKAAKVVYREYSESGISGLVSIVEECYQNLNKYKFYCAYLDIGSRHIDQSMASAMNWPTTEYFNDESFGPRIFQIFQKSNLNMEQSNEYLSNVTPIINNYVDMQFSKKRTH